MLQRHALKMVALLAIAGCTVPAAGGKDQSKIGNVPEAVTAIAAPGQDLTTARLRSDDNCYWYEHNGPVETTLVPLRSTGGNPICVARQA